MINKTTKQNHTGTFDNEHINMNTPTITIQILNKSINEFELYPVTLLKIPY